MFFQLNRCLSYNVKRSLKCRILVLSVGLLTTSSVIGYDAQGRLTSVNLPQVPDPANASQLTSPRYEYDYSAQGTLLGIRDPQGRETRFAYDHLNRQTRRTLPLGQAENAEYDNYGRLARKTDFKGQVTEFVYDSFGRVTAKQLYAAGATEPGKTVAFSYDIQGNLTNILDRQTSGQECQVSYEYDSENRPVCVRSPEGVLHYAYDPATGRKIRTWTDSGTETIYGYDALNRLATVSSVENRDGEIVTNVASYAYTAVGSREAVSLPNGVTTRYAYNALNRLTGLTHINAYGQLLGAYGYTLAADGRRTGAYEVGRHPAIPDGFVTNSVSYTYDELNRLTTETMEHPGVAAAAFDAEYTYDLTGNRVSRNVLAGGKILETRYTYDANDRLVREDTTVQLAALPVAPGGSLLASVGGVDPLSGLLGSSQLASQTASQGFRPLPSVWARVCFQSIPVCMLLAFALPILMGALRLRRRLPAPDRLLTCFRLPLFLRGTASLVAFTMLLSCLPFNTLAQEADLYTQLETSNWGRGGTVTQYEYDDNGSLTRKTVSGAGESTVEDYTYDLENRLASHVRTDSDETGTAVTTTAYRYSPAGGKVGQATTVVMNGVLRPELSESTNYLLDFSNPTGYAQILEELDGAGTLMKSYTIGDDVLSQSVHTTIVDPQLPTGTATYQQASYFLYDGHGSTRQLANSQGSVTAQYAYDSYGVMLGQTSGAQQRQATSLLYSGEQFDTSLQQYHLRARNYNQANGQFTTLDPYAGNIYDPQSLHKYAYCHTDPVNAVDPSGEFALADITMASTIAFGVTGAIVGGYHGGIRGFIAGAMAGILFGFFVGELIAMTLAAGALGLSWAGVSVVSGNLIFDAHMTLATGTALWGGAWMSRGATGPAFSRFFARFGRLPFVKQVNVTVTPQTPAIVPTLSEGGGLPGSTLVGQHAEAAAMRILERKGYTNIIQIQNSSGHGIDIVARNKFGKLRFFEVKGHVQVGVARLSPAQRSITHFVHSRLQNAVSGTGRWANMDPSLQDAAESILFELQSGARINGAIINVNRAMSPVPELSVFRW
jgi:RHS repeat-associated protein